MALIRKRYTPELKAKIGLAAIKELVPLNELASEEGVHPNQIAHWKKTILEFLPEIFRLKHARSDRDREALLGELYQQIGQLKVELDWLKKKSGLHRN